MNRFPPSPTTELAAHGGDVARAAPVPKQRRAWPFPPASVFAPMEGVTHPELRALMAERGGLGLVCTEFVRITKHPVSARQLRSQVQKAPGTALSVQVMGNDAERMAEAAEIVSAAGADVVDINLGCPMPRVVRKGVGAAMLKNLPLLESVLGRMRRATPGLLSAKIRAGFDDADHVLDIARAVEAAGADFITVHPRRRCDLYAGVADWRIIARVRDVLGIPVVGNGDVWYAADALRMQRETGCDAVMIGRPALRNPFLFQQIEALRAGREPFRPDGAALFAAFEETVARLSRYYASLGRAALGPVKELVGWIGRSVNDAGEYRRLALRSDGVDAILELSHARLAALSAAELDLDADGSLRLERSGSALRTEEPAPLEARVA